MQKHFSCLALIIIPILILPVVASNQAIIDKFSVGPNKIGTIVIEGYAYDESKYPVEGALVDVYNTYRNSKVFLARDVELMGSGHTDSEGRFQFVIKQPAPNIDSQFAIIYKCLFSCVGYDSPRPSTV